MTVTTQHMRRDIIVLGDEIADSIQREASAPDDLTHWRIRELVADLRRLDRKVMRLRRLEQEGKTKGQDVA